MSRLERDIAEFAQMLTRMDFGSSLGVWALVGVSLTSCEEEEIATQGAVMRLIYAFSDLSRKKRGKILKIMREVK